MEPLPLEEFADSLPLQNVAKHPLPKKFPMYTVGVDDLLKMVFLTPHEKLLRQGVLVEFDKDMGKAVFITHQWISAGHPDPEFKQMEVLQQSLKKFLNEKFIIHPEPTKEMFGFALKGLPSLRISTEVFQTKPLFIWYDYFSIPQQDPDSWTIGDLAKPVDDAIESIPWYISSCELFLVLYPTVQSPDRSELFGPSTWASRGWCRFERSLRELSPQNSYILIKSSSNFVAETFPQTSFADGGPGLGAFGFQEDRMKLGLIMRTFVRRLLFNALKCRDFPRYRLFLNLAQRFLYGFPRECQASCRELVNWPSSQRLGSALSRADDFLELNGFRHVNEVDSTGFSPMCYAVLNGDPTLVESLLDAKANANERARKLHLGIGAAKSMSVLAMAQYLLHNDAAAVLIRKGALLTSGIVPAMHCASASNNIAGIRLLCKARADLHEASKFGQTPVVLASMAGATEGVAELVAQARLSRRDLSVSGCLHFGLLQQGGSVEMVEQLIAAKADVNEQLRQSSLSPMGIVFLIFRWRHSMQREHSQLMKVAYHIHKATPLMVAILASQYEGAAALLVNGARLDLRNSKKKTALDLAREVSVPNFLMEALEGDKEAFKRLQEMHSAAVSNRYLVMERL